MLVFLGTSRQGAAVVDALLASDKFEVYATTRSAKSAEKLKAKGVKCGPFTCGDAASAKAALDAAEPSLVFFTTLMGSREVEGSSGKIIVDAIKPKGRRAARRLLVGRECGCRTGRRRALQEQVRC